MTEGEELLAAAAADPYADAWDSLYERACHEGFFDADEAFLIPRLADLAGRYAPADRENVLMLAGKIAADLDEANWPQYAEAFATMHRRTNDWLVTPTDPGSFVYRLQAVMALKATCAPPTRSSRRSPRSGTAPNLPKGLTRRPPASRWPPS
ncbi:hypothetical protein [Micromonospora sp. NPDC005305]|uniref:hypothetical protein n=1 Tax=Micromonospora sp. NPDC005305 TaxID=3156875 RepID=UPI0033A3221A